MCVCVCGVWCSFTELTGQAKCRPSLEAWILLWTTSPWSSQVWCQCRWYHGSFRDFWASCGRLFGCLISLLVNYLNTKFGFLGDFCLPKWKGIHYTIGIWDLFVHWDRQWIHNWNYTLDSLPIIFSTNTDLIPSKILNYSQNP